jgi:putative membrane protein
MMDGWGYGGMGAWGWVSMMVLWVALIVLAVWLVAQLFPRRDDPGRQIERPERPEEILDRRLASGEIDTETYNQLRAALSEGHAVGTR